VRFFYAIIAALGWAILSVWLDLHADNNTMFLALAIIMAGAMAGGD